MSQINHWRNRQTPSMRGFTPHSSGTFRLRIADFKNELTDRYGKPPEEANNLLFKIMLKILSKKAGIARLDLAGRQMHLQFSQAHLKNTESLVDMIQAAPGRYELTPGSILKVNMTDAQSGGRRGQAKNILKDIIQRVRN